MDGALLERARRSLQRRDPVLRPIIRRVGPPRIQVRGDPYRSLLRSILYQQLAGRAAAAIHGRFRRHFGGREPRPERLLDTDDATLRGLGLSRQKVAAMRNVAEAFAAGDLSGRRLYRLPDDDVVQALTRVKGVGRWTAHMTLMFSLGRPDVLPVGDYGVRKGAQQLYDLDQLPGPVELEALAACWRPYASVASWYLWRACDIETPDG